MELMERITEANQRHHDLIIELRTLAAEFADHVERMSDLAYRMQVRYEPPKESNIVQLPHTEEFVMPNALKGGPNKRGEV